MNKKLIFKYSIIFAFIFVAGALYYGYKEYNRKSKSSAELKTNFSIKQDELLKAFSADEKAATQKFSGKVLEINGIVKTVETTETGNTTIVLGDSTSLSSIRCSLDSTELNTAFAVQPNIAIHIKGICTGYNADELGLGADVILNKCIILKH